LAFETLELCYDKDEKKAQLTLIRKIPEFNGCTSMQIAIASDDLNFIAHPCFQSVVIKIWYHKVVPDTSKFKVNLS
jgi:hypothetical protein